MDNLAPTNYQGSLDNYLSVMEQIRQRWGEVEAKKYDPRRNARTYRDWKDSGFKVKRGEKSLKSITFVPVENERGEVVNLYKLTCNLFYYKQIERVIA